MAEKSWREFTVQKVTIHDNSVSVDFEECIASFLIKKEHLKKHKINWKKITKGRRLLINGNENVDLWYLDALDEIVLIPEKG